MGTKYEPLGEYAALEGDEYRKADTFRMSNDSLLLLADHIESNPSLGLTVERGPTEGKGCDTAAST